jgi:hypothetical protein
MATVPGNNVTPLIHPAFMPDKMDMLMAAAIHMGRQGNGDGNPVPLPRPRPQDLGGPSADVTGEAIPTEKVEEQRMGVPLEDRPFRVSARGGAPRLHQPSNVRQETIRRRGRG